MQILLGSHQPVRPGLELFVFEIEDDPVPDAIPKLPCASERLVRRRQYSLERGARLRSAAYEVFFPLAKQRLAPRQTERLHLVLPTVEVCRVGLAAPSDHHRPCPARTNCRSGNDQVAILRVSPIAGQAFRGDAANPLPSPA